MAQDLSFLESVEGNAKGFEQPKTTGIKLLTIVRGEDDVLDPNNENYIEGAERGGFIIKSSNMAIPTPVSVIPMEFKQLYAEYSKDKTGMGAFTRYVSLEEGKQIAVDPYKFGQKETKEGNVLQDSYNFIVSLVDYDRMLAMLSFQSSRIPDGEAWFRSMNSQIYNGNKIAPWNLVYSITTKMTGNTKGKWYLIKPTFDRFVSLEEHKQVTDIRSSIGESMLMIEDNTEY